MANTYAFVTGWLAMESLRILQNKLVVADGFNTEYNKEFTKPFPIGEQTLVKFPQRFMIRNGLEYTEQAINRRTTPVVVDQIFGVDFAWDSVEQALKMERGEELIKKEYLEPAMGQLATELDLRAAKYAVLNTPNICGVLGATPTAMSTYSRARTLLVENACPMGNSKTIISPSMNENAVAANAAVFNPASEISREFKEGTIGTYAGSEWFESMSLPSNTAGTWAGAVTVTNAGQSGTQLTITATAGDTFKVGNIFSIATVNNANPATRQSTGRPKTFTVTQDLTAAGGGADVLNIYPSIYGPGDQYQNVDLLPAGGAALTLFPGTSSPNGKSGTNGIRFHRDAFAMVGVEMEKPEKVEMSFQKRDPQTGIAVRFVRAWDQKLSKITNRFDILIGFGTLYAENAAVRILSST